MATAPITLLDRQACLQRLTTVRVGRLGYTKAALPVIHPVPFVLVGSDIVVAVGDVSIRPESWTRVGSI